MTQKLATPMNEAGMDLRPEFQPEKNVAADIARVWALIFGWDGNELRRAMSDTAGLIATRPIDYLRCRHATGDGLANGGKFEPFPGEMGDELIVVGRDCWGLLTLCAPSNDVYMTIPMKPMLATATGIWSYARVVSRFTQFGMEAFNGAGTDMYYSAMQYPKV